ncbi:MAG: hypothetical protein IKZ46_02220 [Victivallales bacterium]|nr:hypothetical protein [Victivallales bacterium]
MEDIVVGDGDACNVAYRLLMADCLGIGATYQRRKELRGLRMAIVVHYPDGMSESVAVTKALQGLNERDFAAYAKDYNDFQQYREFYLPVP